MREMQEDREIEGLGRLTLLAYEDDIVLFGELKIEL